MGLLSILLNRSMQQQAMDAQAADLEMKTKLHELEYGVKKSEVDRMAAERKYLKHAMDLATPQTTEQNPNTAGAVMPWSQNQEGPAAGLNPVAGATPNISPTSLIDLLISAKTMFPGGGDVAANIAPLLQAREKLSNQEMIKNLFGGGTQGSPVNGPVNLRPGEGSTAAGGPQSPIADLIQKAGQGDPNAIAQLGALKFMGLDMGRLPEMAAPKNTFKEGVLEDGRTGLFKIDKNGKVGDEPILTTKAPEWAFSSPQVTPQGTVVYEYRKDLGLQGSFAQGLVSIHQTAPPETILEPTKGAQGQPGLMRVPKIGKPGEVFPTGPAPTKLIPETLPGGGTQEKRVLEQGAPGETISTGPAKGQPPDAAGRIQLAQTGINNVNEVAQMLIKPDGTVDRKLLMKMASPGGGIGQGRKINSLILQAIDAPIRAATGAVVNPSELKNYLNIYSPSNLDSDDLIKDKLSRLYDFNMGYALKIDPTGEQFKRVGPKIVFPGRVKYKQTATNPETGEKIGLMEGGKWVPIKTK